MTSELLYLLGADLLLLVHVAFVVFVIAGLLLTIAGKFLGWRWVCNRTYRMFHLAAIGFVVLQAWLGRICPLTTWEMALRARAGDATYTGSFIAHWLDEILYYQAPSWVFVASYTVFGLAVAATWIWVPPRSSNESA